ncbi:N-acetyl-alpha-D-glucosaminyl L-malate synthase BshA [Alicyclobacillus tolerans]|uniref:N-acetyl-alpha-D-glucosaminyl L-malate synthase BshA n=1 Tax=Alicyclobacillus tolerans TaxID=90970 RepID=UPI001F02C64B|nr:N-acetyl-alpha-D-glucosaminyl L-malate synthase BshA [Alicyclobacillus tolerans]MCF8563783.1 N-acetyl-alpha-D-glucosaminyl L-malate synthase BshA [Alicyclobacillus tolerans]
MRIGISCYPTVGGSGAVATELGKALAHKGHQVHFIVTDVPFRLGEFHQNIFVHEVETTSYPVLRTPPYDFSLAALMADIISQYDLEVLHVHYALPFAVSAFLAKQMVPDHPVRVVTTLHGTDVTVLAQDKSLYNVIRLGIEKSDYVTAVSNSLVSQTKELFETDKFIQCVYNFVDTELFHPVNDVRLRGCFAQPEEKILLHISNFRKVKRITDVIDIFARVNEQIPSKLLFVGEGPELPAARTLVKEYRLDGRVRFLGNQDEVAPLLAAADLFILPSEKESFGLVALEAMACSIPVVGSNAGGIPEVVIHGETGYLADVGNTEEMASYAIRLLSDPELYQRFAQAGRLRAQAHFSIHDKISEYEDIYERLTQGVQI